MTLATLNRAGAPELGELVDALAARSGAWVVVERFGAVVAHGPGAGECPAALAAALLSKSSAPLRAAVRWSRGNRGLTGVLEGASVGAVELGDGVTAWFVGGRPDEAGVALLAEAAHS